MAVRAGPEKNSKRNDESQPGQTVDRMPAWVSHYSGVFFLIQTLAQTLAQAKVRLCRGNLPFEGTVVAQRCDGVVKKKRKAEGEWERARACTDSDTSAPCCVRS